MDNATEIELTRENLNSIINDLYMQLRKTQEELENYKHKEKIEMQFIKTDWSDWL